MTSPRFNRYTAAILTAITIACVAIALWLFPKAQPTIALKQELTRESAIRDRNFNRGGSTLRRVDGAIADLASAA